MKFTLLILAGAATVLADGFRKTSVKAHNAARALHGAPKLKWSDDLANIAQSLSNECVFAHKMYVIISGFCSSLRPLKREETFGGRTHQTNPQLWCSTGNYGQNIGWSTATSAEDAVDKMADMITNQWYGAEVGKFTQYGAATPNLANFAQWGHFTQIVWKATTEVGCAYSTCDSGRGYMFVCNYSPPGTFPSPISFCHWPRRKSTRGFSNC